MHLKKGKTVWHNEKSSEVYLKRGAVSGIMKVDLATTVVLNQKVMVLIIFRLNY